MIILFYLYLNMKKVILFLLSYFLLWCISVSANRYWLHNVAYVAGWTVTACNQDWLWVAWTCAQISWSPAVWTATACSAGPLSVSSTWNIPCLYWDQEVPTTFTHTLWWYTAWTRTNANVVVTPSCVDAWWSWCDTTSYQYREESSNFTCNDWAWTRTTATSRTYSTTWVRYICFRWQDVAKTWYVYSSIGTSLIRVDKTLPTITDDYPAPFKNVWKSFSSRIIEFTPVDSDSWINITRRCVWAWCVVSSWNIWTWLTVTADYNNTIKYQTWDIAWNASAIWSFIVKLDVSPPSSVWMTFSPVYTPWTWTNSSITATITCSDSYSWCDSSTFQYREVPSSATDCTDGMWVRTNTGSVTFSTTWDYYLCFRATDFTANWYTYSTIRNIKIDKTPPTDLFIDPSTDWQYLSTFTTTLTWSDADSWIDNYKWCEWSSCNPATWSSWATITRYSIYNNTINYIIYDVAWNSTIWSFVLKLNGPVLQAKFKDNDSNARSEIVWYIKEKWSLENIFWNNTVSNTYIDKNINNADNAYIKIWEVDSWNIKLTVNTWATIRVVKFDRTKYNQNKELFALESFEWTVLAWSWYIEKSWKNLSLTWTLSSSNIYNFDFKSSDYAIFIKNNWSWILNYKISWVSWTKWIYINPINDSYPKEIRILASHIIISNWIYIWRQTEVIKVK